MANDWFQFKQFRVQQDRCAMKVSTDACIQGAIAAAFCAGNQTGTVLDIGAGTGLLSLMIAQKNPQLQSDALELDEAAYNQAVENCHNSPWKGQIRVFHTALQDFKPSRREAYDFIVCNPPFFHNHLQAAQQQRNHARHSLTLTKEELAAACVQLLRPGGQCCILYPASEWAAWHEAATQRGLYAQQIVSVKPMPCKAANRLIGRYGKEVPAELQEEELVIYSEPQTYTPQFRQLLQPFYLHL
jgi:tRNA1Val (adenine37-N6)-methyltransferase